MTAPTYTRISTTARNSASMSSQIDALVKKHSTSSSAAVHGVAHHDHGERRDHEDRREHPEENLDQHWFSPACAYRYAASAALSALINAS